MPGASERQRPSPISKNVSAGWNFTFGVWGLGFGVENVVWKDLAVHPVWRHGGRRLIDLCITKLYA